MSAYRQNAAPPARQLSKPPTRTIAIACNVLMTLVLFGSLGSCLNYGWTAQHLSARLGDGLALASFFVCVVATLVAIVVLILNLRVRSETSSWVLLVLTFIYGPIAAIFSAIFFVFTESGVGFGFGGWGRPLRINRRAVTPAVRASSEWATGPRPDTSALDDETRALLRDLWLHDARKEHASVPAFGQVAWQLVALGAPADLVRRAHQSCLQEIDHAERCFSLASAYAGEDLGVQDMPALLAGGAALPKNRGRALVKVATEALVDGALLEDFNAELAATALADVRDPAVRAALERVVADEREHARLAWDIIAFCIERGGAEVQRALAARFAKVPERTVSLYDDELAARVLAHGDKSPLHAHGRVRDDRIQEVFRERRAFAITKLATLLDVPVRAA